KVARRRQTTPVTNLVKALLYSKPVNTKGLRWRISHKTDAQTDYKNYLADCGYQNISIHRSGLVIHKDDNSLACSPDGLVKYVAQDGSCHNGIVEYKCPFSLADQKKTPVDGCSSATFFCEVENNEFYPKISLFYRKAVLLEFVLPRYSNKQQICEPFLSQ
uniref:YqaJ viral recombinase domain-containing protein n=1 Tax=Amphimedon queenslandica TaxID=400682 RepID=A0A1X7U5T5_AMPQE